MSLFALQILFAHLLGDFVLQPDKWVQNKKAKKYRSPYLYWHIAVHTLLLFVLLGFQLVYWKAILLIVLTHFLIDLGKISFEKSRNQALLFVLDQAAHLAVLLLAINIYYPFSIPLEEVNNVDTLLFGVALVMVTFVVSIVMRQIMNSWELEENDQQTSLPRAGKYIGMLERLLVFCFIILQQWPAIGWLITAKSVFRFSDLTRAKDRKLTEYILIGTLLSFGFALIIGLAYVYLQDILGKEVQGILKTA